MLVQEHLLGVRSPMRTTGVPGPESFGCSHPTGLRHVERSQRGTLVQPFFNLIVVYAKKHATVIVVMLCASAVLLAFVNNKKFRFNQRFVKHHDSLIGQWALQRLRKTWLRLECSDFGAHSVLADCPE